MLDGFPFRCLGGTNGKACSERFAMSTNNSSDWHGSVYRKVEKKRMDNTLRLSIIERDGNVCSVCSGSKTLEVHHIIPRSEGGSDSRENLITLCKKCHDEVELAEYRTAALIRNHTPEWKQDAAIPRKRPAKIKKALDDDGNEIDDTNWQRWVYGGFKNPRT